MLQNPETYPAGNEPVKSPKLPREVAQVVAQEWQNEAQEHKEKLNEVWKCFSREKILQIQFLFWLTHLGWESEELVVVFLESGLGIFWKWQKKDFRL